MPDRRKQFKEFDARPGELEDRQARALRFFDQRRQNMATRSTLSRLRNRKSALK